jgi:hypothetical protein
MPRVSAPPLLTQSRPERQQHFYMVETTGLRALKAGNSHGDAQRFRIERRAEQRIFVVQAGLMPLRPVAGGGSATVPVPQIPREDVEIWPR